ncbi:MAG: 1-phosphofructokinase family hexose kinase [Butyricicoccus pullicaecorum]
MIITITLNPAMDRTLRIEHPLQPNKLNRAASTSVEPGGKGINVSRAVKALGGESVALGFSAGSNGRAMKDALTSVDIHHDFVDVPGNTRVNVQIIDLDGNHTEINEPGFKISDGDFLRFLERVEHYLDNNNIFVISGSVPPGFPLVNFIELIKTIKKAGCRLIVDEAGDLMREALKFEPDFVKPNIFELAELVGDEPTADPDQVVHSARKLLDMGAQAVCVSMGAEGALFASKNEPEVLYVTVTPRSTMRCCRYRRRYGRRDCKLARQKLSFVDMAKFTVDHRAASGWYRNGYAQKGLRSLRDPAGLYRLA